MKNDTVNNYYFLIIESSFVERCNISRLKIAAKFSEEL